MNLSDTLYAGPEHRPFVMPPAGKGFRGSALLLHGFLGTPAEMRPLSSWLAANGWLVYAPLLPGLGTEIDRLGQTRRQDWVRAAFTAGASLRRRARPLLLCGYSMGAAVALHVAAALKADLLLLLAPFWQVGDWRAYPLSLLKYIWPEVTPLARADFQDRRLREFLGRIAPSLALDDEAVQTTLREEVIFPTATLGELLFLGREGYRLAPSLWMPALVMQGLEDELVTRDATRALVSQIGGPVSYHEVPGDHEFPRELGAGSPGAVEGIIGKFIERNLRR